MNVERDFFGETEDKGLADHLAEITTSLPEDVEFGSGVVHFQASGDMTVSSPNRRFVIPLYTSEFIPRDGSGEVNWSLPLPDLPILYTGCIDDHFTLSPEYLGIDEDFGVIGFNPKHGVFGIPHEQGHAYIHRQQADLKLFLAVQEGDTKLLPPFPYIEPYYEHLGGVLLREDISFKVENRSDLVSLVRSSKQVEVALKVFEERFATGIGLAFTSFYPGFWSRDQADYSITNNLRNYALTYHEVLFHGFAKGDSIGNIAFFFEELFKEQSRD